MAWTEKDNNSIRKIAPTLSVKKVTKVDKPPNSPGSVKIVSPDKGYKRLKQCKRGYREVSLRRVCGMILEGLPVWLWSIRLADWSVIYVSDEDEKRLKRDHLMTWDFQ